jgi:hypothetical protein
VGTAFGWIEWLSNGTGHRFLASYAFYFQSEIPNISLLPKSHILFIFPKKLPWPKSKPHSIVKTAAHNMRAGKGMHYLQEMEHARGKW